MADIIKAKNIELLSLIKPVKKYKTVNAGKVYKVVGKDEKFLHVVFYAKVKNKNFKSHRSLLATYKANKKMFPLEFDVELTGKDVHSLEKYDGKKAHDETIKLEAKKIKLEREISEYIDEQIKIALAEEKEEREKLFVEELSRLKKQGILFLYEHRNFSISELAKFGSKKLGADGWRYCFEYEEGGKTLYHFQRPVKDVAKRT